MMEYLIVHRGDKIYRLCFDRDGEELYHRQQDLYQHQLKTDDLIFHPINGWIAHKVMEWLDDRGFEYHWEQDND